MRKLGNCDLTKSAALKAMFANLATATQLIQWPDLAS